MPTLFYDADEWFPVLKVSDHDMFGKSYEFTDEELDLLRQADKLFVAAQKMLAKKYDVHGHHSNDFQMVDLGEENAKS